MPGLGPPPAVVQGSLPADTVDNVVQLQRMPHLGQGLGADDADRLRVCFLTGRVSRLELIDSGMAPETLLRRLFPEDEVRFWQPVTIEARRRYRVEAVLRSFPARKFAGMVVNGVVTATCEFCSSAYTFHPSEFWAVEESD